MKLQNNVFLISLPRAGSTLLQRLLVKNFKVTAPPEPWLLLPMIWQFKNFGMEAIYGAETLQKAVSAFFDGNDKVIGESVRSYYNIATQSKINDSESCFLDKTPRYSLIAPEINQLFPSSKYIYLWRHPIEIAFSMINAWKGGRPIFESYLVDFTLGTRGWASGLMNSTGNNVVVKYESLIRNPIKVLEELESRFGLIRLNKNLTNELGEVILGMGDPVGQYVWNKASDENHQLWFKKRKISFPVKHLLKTIIGKIDDEYLRIGGTSKLELISEIQRCPVSYATMVSDLFWVIITKMERIIRFRRIVKNFNDDLSF